MQRLDGFAAWQEFNAPSERTRRLFEELAKDVPTDTRFAFVVAGTLERLDETLESLIGQSYGNFEIVLIEEADNAPRCKRHSSDGSSGIIDFGGCAFRRLSRLPPRSISLWTA